jgi:hypothetical protein
VTRGLYFIGEVVDVTGWLGGYNFQWAWASGALLPQLPGQPDVRRAERPAELHGSTATSSRASATPRLTSPACCSSARVSTRSSKACRSASRWASCRRASRWRRCWSRCALHRDAGRRSTCSTPASEKLDKIPPRRCPRRDAPNCAPSWPGRSTRSVYPAYGKLIAYHERCCPRRPATTAPGACPTARPSTPGACATRPPPTWRRRDPRIGLAEVERIAAEMDAILQGRRPGRGHDRRARAADRQARGPALPRHRRGPRADPGRLPGDHRRDQRGPRRLVRPHAGGGGRGAARAGVLREDRAGRLLPGPVMDGKRPGVFFANLRNVSEIPRFGMRTLAYHEAVPGHHFQIALAQELKGLPIFRASCRSPSTPRAGRCTPSRSPGRPASRPTRWTTSAGCRPRCSAPCAWWSTPACTPALEPRAGDRLHAGLHRHGRGRGDRRDRALPGQPGQALAYKVGMLKILELRAKAQRELGEVRHPRLPRHRVVLPIFILGGWSVPMPRRD